MYVTIVGLDVPQENEHLIRSHAHELCKVLDKHSFLGCENGFELTISRRAYGTAKNLKVKATIVPYDRMVKVATSPALVEFLEEKYLPNRDAAIKNTKSFYIVEATVE